VEQYHTKGTSLPHATLNGDRRRKVSIDLYDRSGIFVHHLNAHYESLTETVAAHDGQELCLRDPI
jgi:hypothetical protein